MHLLAQRANPWLSCHQECVPAMFIMLDPEGTLLLLRYLCH
jgi:hypothetical protein